MPSIYHHHKYGLYSDSFIISSSSSVINKMLYGGADFVPTAVPCFCLIIFFLNVNMLFFNTTSAKFVMVSDKTNFSFRVSSRFLNADKPSSCSMFGYNHTVHGRYYLNRLFICFVCFCFCFFVVPRDISTCNNFCLIIFYYYYFFSYTLFLIFTLCNFCVPIKDGFLNVSSF